MKTGFIIVALFALVLAAGFTTAGDDPDPVQLSSAPSDQQRREAPSLVSMTDEQALKMNSLLQDMRKILIAEKDQLAELYVEFERETDSQGALAIQRRIHETKTGTQIALLRAQADVAREEGRSEDADLLEEGIAKLANPERGLGANVVPSGREMPTRQ